MPILCTLNSMHQVAHDESGEVIEVNEYHIVEHLGMYSIKIYMIQYGMI